MMKGRKKSVTGNGDPRPTPPPRTGSRRGNIGSLERTASGRRSSTSSGSRRHSSLWIEDSGSSRSSLYNSGSSLADAIEFRKNIEKGLQDSESSLSSLGLTSTASSARESMRRRSSFTLTKLAIADLRIYGREDEMTAVADAYYSFREKEEGHHRMVLISGYSGTGKSSLAQLLQKPVRKNGGIFVSGKFDLTKHVQPYTAFASAYSELCEELCDDIMVSTKKTNLVAAIEEAVGSEGKVLTNIVPSLKKIIGEQEQESATGKLESKNRLRFLFRKFTRAVCDHQPLVLFLDDMQWADAGSLDLVESLLTDTENDNLFIVMTCRDNEIDSTHPFTKTLNAIDEAKVSSLKVILVNLDVEAVNSLVSDALRSNKEDILPLAEIIHRKTLGNPYFVIEFLKFIYHRDMLRYNFGLHHWLWDEGPINALNATDNIADLLSHKLRKLHFQTQFTLQAAACLGQRFKCKILTLAMGKLEESNLYPEEDSALNSIQTILGECVEEGLIQFDGSTGKDKQHYAFVHDQIQNTALTLIPDEKRPLMQLIIGRALLEQLSDEEYADSLFVAVDLCNAGSSAISAGDEERVNLAKLNLLAAEKAMKTSAFVPAEQYMETGLAHLGPDRWERNYALTLDLSTGAAEAMYCNGKFTEMQQSLDSVIQQENRKFEDKVRAYMTQIEALSVQCNFEKGIDTGFLVLEQMNLVQFPKQANAATGQKEFKKTKHALRKHDSSTLSQLPDMVDQKRVDGMRVLDMMATMTYFSRTEYLPLIVCRMVRWNLKYGVCKYSPRAFAIFGLMLCGHMGDFQGGFLFGEVAIALSERLDARETMAGTISIVYGMINHWTVDAHLSLKPFLFGYRVGMETGDIRAAVTNLDFYGLTLWTTSRRLDALDSEMQVHVKFMTNHKQDAIGNPARCRWQWILNVRGESLNPVVLTGKAMNQEAMKKLATETQNVLLVMVIDSYRMSLAYLFREYELSNQLAEATESLDKILVGNMFVPRHVFYSGLAAFAVAHIAGKQDKKAFKKHTKRATEITKKMKIWNESGNVNCEHMVLFLEAEMAALQGEMEPAEKNYRDCIAIARRNGYLQDRALAHERASMFFNELNEEYWAKYHLEQSIECYTDWGAKAKVRQLEELHQVS